MAFSIRQPSLADAPAIAALHVSTWQEAYAHLLPEQFFDERHARGRRDQWEFILGHPSDEWTVRVAIDDQRIVGFAMAGPSFGAEGESFPRERQLYSLYVVAARHGAGVGQALLDAVLGDEPAMLWVAKQNPRAVAFYRRNGFEFDGAEQVDPGAPSITDGRMVR